MPQSTRVTDFSSRPARYARRSLTFLNPRRIVIKGNNRPTKQDRQVDAVEKRLNDLIQFWEVQMETAREQVKRNNQDLDEVDRLMYKKPIRREDTGTRSWFGFLEIKGRVDRDWRKYAGRDRRFMSRAMSYIRR